VNKSKIIAILLILALLLVPSVLAAPTATTSKAVEHSVQTDLSSFVSAFQALFNNNSDGVVEGLVGSLPLFGLIFIVYAFAYFLCILTIFNKNEHHRYANMVAIGLSILGIGQQKVYNTILNWSTTFVTITFIIAIVFMTIMFINYNRRRHFETNSEMFDSQKSYLTAKKDVNALKHDLNKDDAQYKKAESDLAHVDQEIDNFDHLAGDELKIVDQISKLFEKITAHKDDPHKFVGMLRNHLGALMNRLGHEQHDYKKLDEHVDKLTKEFADWGYDIKAESHADTHLANILKHHAAKKGHTVTKTPAEIHAFLNSVGPGVAEIKQLLVHIRSEMASLKHLHTKLTTDTEGPLHRFGPDVKHNIAVRMREAALNGDYQKANTELDHLRNLIQKERHVLSQVHHINNEIHRHLSRIENYETQLHKHMLVITASI